jgi:hypothetical protein
MEQIALGTSKFNRNHLCKIEAKKYKSNRFVFFCLYLSLNIKKTKNGFNETLR